MNAHDLRRISASLKKEQDARDSMNDVEALAARLSATGINLRCQRLIADPDWVWKGPGARALEVEIWENEESAQRQIFLNRLTTLEGDPTLELEWLEFEFPTRPREQGKSGEYLKVDLLAGIVGDTTSQPTRCFVELKYAQPTWFGESPVAALVQSLAYVVDGKTHADVLSQQKGSQLPNGEMRNKSRFPKNWTPAIIVAGNKRYWEHWESELRGLGGLRELGRSVEALLLEDDPDAQQAPWVRFASFSNMVADDPKSQSMDETGKKISLQPWDEARIWKSI